MGRITYWISEDQTEDRIVTVAEAKRLLKTKGGSAFTQHSDRDGSIQECTPIVLGNNANTTYRAKYNTSKCYKK